MLKKLKKNYLERYSLSGENEIRQEITRLFTSQMKEDGGFALDMNGVIVQMSRRGTFSFPSTTLEIFESLLAEDLFMKPLKAIRKLQRSI